MADTIVVSLQPSRIQVKPGERGMVTVVVNNRAEEVGHYELRAEGVEAGWFEFSPAQLSAFPLQEARAQLLLHPPADARGATYHLTVRAVHQEREGIEGRGLLDVEVPAPLPPAPPPSAPEPAPVTLGPQAASQIEVKLEPVKEDAPPPPARQWRLTVRNRGHVLDTFSFSIVGIRPTWVNIEPAELTLGPDESGPATLIVRPGEDAPAKTYPFTLRTFSHLNLNQRTEVALEVQVQPRAAFKLGVFPREAEAQGAREFKVALTSDPSSNTDLWLDLSASDQDNACDYVFEPGQVFVPARQVASSTLKARPRNVLSPNGRRTYTLTVVATARGLAAAQSEQVRLTQVGAPPVSLNLQPKVQTADLQADYTLIAINPSGVEMALALSAEDPEVGCVYTFQPPKLMLPPAGQAQAVLRVQARQYLDGEAQKSFPFTVSATRGGELVPTAQVEGTLVQRPVKPIALALVPQQQSRPGSVTFFVRAGNPRPSPVGILLEASDEAAALSFSFNPSLLQLSPGAEGRATLIVRPKEKLAPGEPRRVHKLTVTGRVEGSGAAIVASGTLAQVRGLDLGSALGKGVRWTIWLLKWIVFIAVLIFVVDLAFAGMDKIGEYNPALRSLFNSFMPSSVNGLIRRLPSDRLARAIVDVVVQIVDILLRAR